MTRLRAGSLVLDVQVDGPADGPPVLLVSGFSQQRTDWPPLVLQLLLARGCRVVTFDNRDVGESDLASEPYRVADLAADAAGVLDAVGAAAAHVVGVSMGGMVAQQLAVDAPGRLLSLTSVMSTTGRREDTVTQPEAAAVLAAGPAHDEEHYVAIRVEFARVCGSPSHPPDPAAVEAAARVAYRRGYDADGILRQFRAIFAKGQDRTGALARVTAPTLVVHGQDDPLIGPRGGEATAAAVPGATLWLVPGMGHDLPDAVLPELVDRLASLWELPAPRGAAG